MFWAFIIGNIMYYATGIILAFAFHYGVLEADELFCASASEM